MEILATLMQRFGAEDDVQGSTSAASAWRRKSDEDLNQVAPTELNIIANLSRYLLLINYYRKNLYLKVGPVLENNYPPSGDKLWCRGEDLNLHGIAPTST